MIAWLCELSRPLVRADEYMARRQPWLDLQWEWFWSWECFKAEWGLPLWPRWTWDQGA